MPSTPSSRDDLSAAEGEDSLSFEKLVERLDRVRPADLSTPKISVSDLTGHSVGRYEVRRLIGQGAFGMVYQARDEQLGRDVAIKVPRPEVLCDEGKLSRFEREAATVATLDHPSIVPIYEADLIGPTPYIASAYCDGPDLGKWLEKHKSPIPVEQATRFVIKLAEAVHYAHRQRVLHRDLKPSNVLLEPCHDIGIGSDQLEHFEPKLTDFGLAKLLNDDRHETQSSLMLGTPLYMAPEQVDRRLGDVGVPTDVHALGTILYELITGCPTFRDSSQVELLLAIREREVTPPSQIRPSLTPTLEAICLRALEKRPHSRYSTALELAEDLGRFLRGEPTFAKPLGLPSRAAKWIRLNPLAATLLAVVSTSIVGLVLGVLWHNHRLSEQLAVSDRLRIESSEHARQFLRARYVADMQLTQQAISGGRFSEAKSRLEKYQPGSEGEEVSDFAWHLLADQLRKTLVNFDFHGPQMSLATSEVLKVSVTGGKDGMLRFFDTSTGVQLSTTQAHEGSINALVFAADGTTLASGGDDGMLCVWNTSSLLDREEIELVNRRVAHADDLFCLAITPAGKLIASGGADNKLYLWNLDDLEPAGELVGHNDWVRSLDFSPDGKFLVSGSDDEVIRRWDMETKQVIASYIGHKKYVLCLKHHPTEPLLVSGGTDRTIRFWNLSTGKERQQLDVFNGWIRSLDFSADGNRIAASADDPRAFLFERAPNGQYEQTKVAFTDRTKNIGVAFANSDSQVVSAGIAGASVWSVDSELVGKAIFKTPRTSYGLASSPKGDAFVLVAGSGVFRIPIESGSSGEIPLSPRDAQISWDGRLIASIPSDRSESKTQVYLSEGKKKSSRLLYSSDGYFNGIGISSSGKFVAAATPDLQIRIWQAPDFKHAVTVRSPFETDCDSLFIDDTGKQLFLQAVFGHEMIVLDVASAKTVAVLPNIEGILNRSVDGRLLAVSRSDYSVAIYDTQTHQTFKILPNHASEVLGACFAPVEPLVATITREGEITLWALDTGEQLIQFQAAFSEDSLKRAHLAFASEGRVLGVSGSNTDVEDHRHTELRIWRVR